MLSTAKSYLHDLAHLFFPHNCIGCGSDALAHDQLLCMRCFSQLPETGFFHQPKNTIEKMFYGRMNVQQAGSAFYFTKSSLLQELIFGLKYKGNKEAGLFLGKLCGHEMKQGQRFENVDAIVPLPLNSKKEKVRGYNQAALIAQGMADVLGIPVLENIVTRSVFTETQTHKDRVSRWQNMDGVFIVKGHVALQGKHILLVDDVVTTGATLEACGASMLEVADVKLSIATVAYTI